MDVHDTMCMIWHDMTWHDVTCHFRSSPLGCVWCRVYDRYVAANCLYNSIKTSYPTTKYGTGIRLCIRNRIRIHIHRTHSYRYRTVDQTAVKRKPVFRMIVMVMHTHARLLDDSFLRIYRFIVLLLVPRIASTSTSTTLSITSTTLSIYRNSCGVSQSCG